MILLIDNYDSFTHNLYQALASFDPNIMVVRNDQISIEDIRKLQPSAIVISPGPGRPEVAGICIELIRTFHSAIPILGICLGHQAIGIAFGASVCRAPEILHGKSSLIFYQKHPLFHGMTNPFEAGRYHSLIVTDLPKNLVTIANDQNGIVMAIRHERFPVFGVQFHPESILTPEGKQILKNFMEICHVTKSH